MPIKDYGGLGPKPEDPLNPVLQQQLLQQAQALVTQWEAWQHEMEATTDTQVPTWPGSGPLLSPEPPPKTGGDDSGTPKIQPFSRTGPSRPKGLPDVDDIDQLVDFEYILLNTELEFLVDTGEISNELAYSVQMMWRHEPELLQTMLRSGKSPSEVLQTLFAFADNVTDRVTQALSIRGDSLERYWLKNYILWVSLIRSRVETGGSYRGEEGHNP